MRKVVTNGSFDILSKFFEGSLPGSLFIYSDFIGKVKYDCARSTIERLCDTRIIARVAPGVFVKLNEDGCIPELDIINVAKAIGRKSGNLVKPKSRTLEALSSGIPIEDINLIFWTTGSSRTCRLYNGLIITFRHATLDKCK